MEFFFAGETDKSIDVFIQDSSSATGAGLTGLAYNSAGLTCYYRKGATGSATALTLASQTVGGAHTDGGFVEISSANMPGHYRLDLSDGMIDTQGYVHVQLKGAANMAPVSLRIPVLSATRGITGTSVPAVAFDAPGGIPSETTTRDAVHAGTVITGTADTGSDTETIVIKTSTVTPTVANQFKGRVVLFTSDTPTAALRGQGAPIDSSTTTEIIVAVADAFTTPPAEDDTFVIV